MDYPPPGHISLPEITRGPKKWHVHGLTFTRSCGGTVIFYFQTLQRNARGMVPEALRGP